MYKLLNQLEIDFEWVIKQMVLNYSIEELPYECVNLIFRLFASDLATAYCMSKKSPHI